MCMCVYVGRNRCPCLADHEQVWQPYSVDLYSAETVLLLCIYLKIVCACVYVGRNRCPCFADREQVWQPYSVDLYSAETVLLLRVYFKHRMCMCVVCGKESLSLLSGPRAGLATILG